MSHHRVELVVGGPGLVSDPVRSVGLNQGKRCWIGLSRRLHGLLLLLWVRPHTGMVKSDDYHILYNCLICLLKDKMFSMNIYSIYENQILNLI